MANEHYAPTFAFTPDTVAVGEQIVFEHAAIEVAFDGLPTKAQLASGSPNHVVAGGTADAIVISAPQGAWTTYTGKDGYEFTFQVAGNNTTAVTINVDGLGAVALSRSDGAALQADDLVATGPVAVTYNESASVFYVKHSVPSYISDQAANAPAASETGIVKATGVAFEGTVVDGNAVYWDGGNNRFARAIADGSVAQELIGIADVTNAKVEMSGVLSSLTSGLVSGTAYYLSNSVAGGLTTGKTPVRAGIARTAASLFINIEAAGSENLHDAAPTTITASTTLTSTSSKVQIVNGNATDINITLPSATTLTEGYGLFSITNRSSKMVSLLNSSGVSIGAVGISKSETIHLYDDSTAAGEWGFDSGQSIVEGDDVVFNTTSTVYTSDRLDTDKVIACYLDSSNSTRPTAVIISTGSGVPASGTSVEIDVNTGSSISVVSLSATQALVIWVDSGTNQGTACVLDVSGTTITVGAQHIFEAATYAYGGLVKLSSTKAVAGFRQNSNGNTAAVALSISGSTVTSGAKVDTGSSNGSNPVNLCALSATKAVMAWGSSDSTVVIDVSGTTITMGAVYTVSTGGGVNLGIVTVDATTVLTSSAENLALLSISGTVMARISLVYLKTHNDSTLHKNPRLIALTAEKFFLRVTTNDVFTSPSGFIITIVNDAVKISPVFLLDYSSTADTESDYAPLDAGSVIQIGDDVTNMSVARIARISV